MKYIDTGKRDPETAVTRWIEREVNQVRDARFQSGYFSGNAIQDVGPAITSARQRGGSVRIAIGSNAGVTASQSVRDLMAEVQPDSGQRRIGVVSYESGLFHPKVFHFTRIDGSMSAYIGSANLTPSGFRGKNIEAGIILDTAEGDRADILTEVAEAVDFWFQQPRDGLSEISNEQDILALIARGVLDVPMPKSVRPPAGATGQGRSRGHSLRPLVQVAPVRRGAAGVLLGSGRSVVSAGSTRAMWSKVLSASDAQRKLAGNQRGSITLVAAGYPINAQTYFRRDFFVTASWQTTASHANGIVEVAEIDFATSLLGRNYGTVRMRVSYDGRRESAQANYTTLLHLDALAGIFSANNLTGRTITLRRTPSGSFQLAIA